MTDDAESVGGSQQWDDDAEWSFWVDIDAQALHDAIRAVAPCVGELFFEFSDDRILVYGIDPANCLYAESEIQSDQYSGLDRDFEVKLPKEDIIGELGISNVYRFEVEKEDSLAHAEFTHGWEEDVGTHALDPDARPEYRPDRSEVDYTGEFDTQVQLPAPKFRGAFGALAEAESGGIIRVTTHKDSVHVELLKSLSKDVVFEWFVDADCEPGCSGIYSADFVADIADCISRKGDLDIRFGERFPMRVASETEQYVLAPRIPRDEQELPEEVPADV
jgi:hypothetical protein